VELVPPVPVEPPTLVRPPLAGAPPTGTDPPVLPLLSPPDVLLEAPPAAVAPACGICAAAPELPAAPAADPSPPEEPQPTDVAVKRTSHAHVPRQVSAEQYFMSLPRVAATILDGSSMWSAQGNRRPFARSASQPRA